MRTVGATVLVGLWALEWAWHDCRSHSFGRLVGVSVVVKLRNLHAKPQQRSSGICTPNLNSLALIVFRDLSVHPDGQTDR